MALVSLASGSLAAVGAQWELMDCDRAVQGERSYSALRESRLRSHEEFSILRAVGFVIQCSPLQGISPLVYPREPALCAGVCFSPHSQCT